MANTLNLGTDGNWATKENSLLGYNSENGNYKPLPFDFTRASNGTFVNKSGLIETAANGVPRIDFLGNTSGALLLEPQRSNLYTYSNDVSFWTKSNVVTTSNYAISPEGTQNAFRAVFSSSVGLLYITSTGTTGTNNTLSVWAKSNGGNSNKFRFFGNGNTTISNDYTATNEWQRFEFTYNCTSITSGLTGASDSATNDILFYGFQHEVGSYSTSLINTQGSAVTRVTDVCNNGGNDQVINSTEGVLYAEISALADDILITGSEISISDGTSNNLVRVLYSPATSLNSIFVRIDVGGVRVATFNYTSITITDFNKVAVKWKENDFALWINGIEVLTDLSGATFSSSTLSTINFSKAVGGDNFYGNTKDLRVYNTALTDAELIALTS